MPNESELYPLIQLEATRLGARLFRNNVGVFKVGNRKIRTGLCVGSSDFIGWTRRGRFLAVEVKRPGYRPTQQQKDFMQAVRRAGGLADVVTSVEQLVVLLSMDV